MERFELNENRVGESNTAGAAVFGFAEKRNSFVEIDVAPFKLKDFAAPSSGCESEKDDGVEKG